MKIVDVHNHFYPPEYLDALRSGKSVVRVTMDSKGNPHVHYPGDYNVAVPGHRDIDPKVFSLRQVRLQASDPGLAKEYGPAGEEMRTIFGVR